MSTGVQNEFVANVATRFLQTFGRRPKWIVAAPGRVNIIGEHIDYNDGFVLPMAIDHYCYICADVVVQGKKRATLMSSGLEDAVEIDLDNVARHETPGHWSNYFTGVIAGCQARNMHPPVFDALVSSNVPVGGGLSSSAAIEVATATLIEAMTCTQLDPVEKALLCQQAEHGYAGVPCGIMDQFASTLCRSDQLMLLDCRSRRVEHIPFVNPNITVLIFNTNVRHQLSGGEYAERRRQCESAAKKLGVGSLRDVTLPQLEKKREALEEVEYRRARHVVTEISRTIETASAIKVEKWDLVGELMNASHDSMRDDFNISCDELNLVVDLAKQIGRAEGVIGCRMTGGGFGGCTVSLVKTERVEAISKELAELYRAMTGIEPGFIISRPSRGAHAIVDT